MKVDLIAYTPNPDIVSALGAATCTAYEGNPMKALKGARSRGHESVMEHSYFTFVVEGISRITLGQLVRHRMASYSVESQRYAKARDAKQAVIPPKFRGEDLALVQEWMRGAWDLYEHLIERGYVLEDARYVLPEAAATKVQFTMNARELRHFFSLRCCSRAQWEIREMAIHMLDLCQEVAPELFYKAGPTCLRKMCQEGSMSCGKPWLGGKRRD